MLSGVCWGRVWDSAVEGCAAAHISCERWMFHAAEPRMQKTVMLQESRVMVSGDQKNAGERVPGKEPPRLVGL